MAIPRKLSAHVVLSGHLYVFGGRNHLNIHENSVEYYNPSVDKWQTVAPMLHAISEATACVSNGFIYVLGGICAEGVLRSIEKYDPREDLWIKVHRIDCVISIKRIEMADGTHILFEILQMEFVLSSRRYWHSVGSLADGDWIYAAGGASYYHDDVKVFEKINFVTGESVKWKDIRSQCFCCHLMKF